MVESPTYFHALHPALEALKEMEIERFKLRTAIVNAEAPLSVDIPEQVFEDISQLAKPLDDSQEEAFFHCLTNKLAIIQGPPGKARRNIFLLTKLKRYVHILFSSKRNETIIWYFI